MGTPRQTYKHEAASPLGCLCHSPCSFCWEPGAPAQACSSCWQTRRQACRCCWQTWRRTRSSCWQTWTQTCCCQTCWATWWTSKQQRKIVHLEMHLDSRTENLDPLDDMKGLQCMRGRNLQVLKISFKFELTT